MYFYIKKSYIFIKIRIEAKLLCIYLSFGRNLKNIYKMLKVTTDPNWIPYKIPEKKQLVDYSCKYSCIITHAAAREM